MKEFHFEQPSDKSNEIVRALLKFHDDTMARFILKPMLPAGVIIKQAGSYEHAKMLKGRI